MAAVLPLSIEFNAAGFTLSNVMFCHPIYQSDSMQTTGCTIRKGGEVLNLTPASLSASVKSSWNAIL
jgi:hypothetical protein